MDRQRAEGILGRGHLWVWLVKLHAQPRTLRCVCPAYKRAAESQAAPKLQREKWEAECAV